MQTGSISRALELLGIEQSEDACAARLSFDAVGSRRSASYGNVYRVCWTGWTVTVTTTLTIDGAPVATWAASDYESPPSQIQATWCPGQDAAIRVQAGKMAIEPFHATWGEPGYFAISAASSTSLPGDITFTDDVVQLTATNLLNEPPSGQGSYTPLWQVLGNSVDDMDQEARAALRPLTPTFISLLNRDKGNGLRTDSITSTLEAITGQSFETSAEWWAWWQSQ